MIRTKDLSVSNPFDDIIEFWDRQQKEAVKLEGKGKEIEAIKQELIGCRVIIEWLLRNLEIEELKKTSSPKL